MSRRTARRRFLKLAAAGGAAGAVFGRALLALAAEKGKVTAEMVRQAEWITGLSFTDAEREMMLQDLDDAAKGYQSLRAVVLDNAVAPALHFRPLEASAAAPPVRPAAAPPARRPPPPAGADPLFLTARELSDLVRRRAVSPGELLRLSLQRMEKLDGTLLAVASRTEALAREQASAAEKEIAAGRWKGPLHGIPWGAKDIVSVAGAPTSWGSRIFRGQIRPGTATVAARLAAAGGVLVAKTSVGELAMGDVWYGGTTRNPWKLEEGSSGSSAGSAAGVAAGYFPYAIGTETWGSIVSPATRCGVTGLRPTFGRISRHGVMALSWSMDKVGVLARSAEDCALVLAAVHGADPLDPDSATRPFPWPPDRRLSEIRVGVAEKMFERPPDDPDDASPAARQRGAEQRALDRAALEALKSLGVKLVPFEVPDDVPVPPLAAILSAEAAAAFDELLRTGRVREMVRQVKDAWPNQFRLGQLVPAVEYIRANRIRTLVMREMEERMAAVDLFVAPTHAGDTTLLTNLTGHPQVSVPDGFRSDGTPGSVTFTGRLYGEAEMLRVAMAWQEATGFHRRRPPGG